jgi:hypothetical protein
MPDSRTPVIYEFISQLSLTLSIPAAKQQTG